MAVRQRYSRKVPQRRSRDAAGLFRGGHCWRLWLLARSATPGPGLSPLSWKNALFLGPVTLASQHCPAALGWRSGADSCRPRKYRAGGCRAVARRKLVLRVGMPLVGPAHSRRAAGGPGADQRMNLSGGVWHEMTTSGAAAPESSPSSGSRGGGYGRWPPRRSARAARGTRNGLSCPSEGASRAPGG